MSVAQVSTPQHHRNNLDAVRIGAAMLVLIAHSFALTGRVEPSFLTWVTLGPLGVYIFFSISGYLVLESWRRDPNVMRFLARRALRIFPGLAVCVLLSAFVLGPAITTLPVDAYFRHSLPYTYAWSNIALSPVFGLPGVFEHNVFPNAVNGSIWTLPVEVSMYLLLAVIGLGRGNRWVMAAWALLWAVLAYMASLSSQMVVFYGSDLRQIAICGVFFCAGAVYRDFALPGRFTLTVTVLAMLALLGLQPWPMLGRMVSWALLPGIVLAFGLSKSPALQWLTRSGDYSYGVYIYAFPVQQFVSAYWPHLSIGSYIAAVTGIVFVFAVLSWHLVEAPALKFKPRGRGSR